MGLRRWFWRQVRRPRYQPGTFTGYVHDRLNGREPGRPLMTKLDMVATAQRSGAKVPRTLAVYQSPADFEPSLLPERFVLKPTNLHSGKGVMILSRQGSGFYCQLRKDHLTRDAIIAQQTDLWNKSLKARPDRPFALIAEERLEDESGDGSIPFDYKLYAFAGDVRFIVQIDRNTEPTRSAFWDGKFEPLSLKTHFLAGMRSRPGDHRRPRCWREMIDMAETISLALRTPFIRVDMFATPQGPVVGELTPTPGGSYFGQFYFQPWFDKELGDAWAAAAARLKLQDPS